MNSQSRCDTPLDYNKDSIPCVLMLNYTGHAGAIGATLLGSVSFEC